jgi:23S rRNA (adenine2030-N6)-methyltransferase
MLSYRHSFHAGNFADVLKHIVLVEILEHLCKKDAGFDYIDTHSGAGLFNLKSAHAKKLEEHSNGIAKLAESDFPELKRYFDVINGINQEAGANRRELSFYPGSPSFAKHYLRRQDRGWLFELHPEDFKTLGKNTERQRKIRVSKEDGLKGLLGLVPPASRRAVVLVDPSYEVKTEYDQVVTAIKNAHKKFPSGTYAVWYPMINRNKINEFERQFVHSGIRNIQRFELGLSADDNDERGMTSSGMIVINPPWTLHKKMSELLPKLTKTLAGDEGVYKCDVLVDE